MKLLLIELLLDYDCLMRCNYLFLGENKGEFFHSVGASRYIKGFNCIDLKCQIGKVK